MGRHTWEEALEGLTPDDVDAMRKMRQFLRLMLFSDRVNYETNERGHILERIEVNWSGDMWHIENRMDTGDHHRPMALLFMALNEVVWMEDGKLKKVD